MAEAGRHLWRSYLPWFTWGIPCLVLSFFLFEWLQWWWPEGAGPVAFLLCIWDTSGQPDLWSPMTSLHQKARLSHSYHLDLSPARGPSCPLLSHLAPYCKGKGFFSEDLWAQRSFICTWTAQCVWPLLLLALGKRIRGAFGEKTKREWRLDMSTSPVDWM